MKVKELYLNKYTYSGIKDYKEYLKEAKKILY